MRLELKRKACLWQAVTNDGKILYSSIDKNRVTEFINTWSRQVTQTLKTRIPLNRRVI